jgi:hypothetical protein
VSGALLLQFALRGLSLSLFCLPQLEVRAVSQSILFTGAGFYDDCGSGQQLLGLDVDAIAAGLAQAATDAPLGPYRRGEEAAVFHRRPERIQFRADAHELESVVAGVSSGTGRTSSDASMGDLCRNQRVQSGFATFSAHPS